MRIATGYALFFYGIAYTSAAVCKLVASGPGWIAGTHLQLWLAEREVDMIATHGTFTPNMIQQWIASSPALATVMLAFGLVAELGATALWFPRTRPFAALALVGMHVGIALSLDIWFGYNVYLLLALGLPWGALLDRLLPRRT
jgi:hypothetical protein